MRLLDHSCGRPEENLALDEVLLNRLEAGEGPETLRFWESPVPFVVLGVSQKVREYVYEDACERDGVPVFRRCSAGGCVLQGPGSFNFTLAIRYENHPEAHTIRGSYCYILNAIGAAFERRALRVRHHGISDLAIDGQKVSGNAQKRRKHAMLHHGTLLYGLDAGHMERYLRHPADRPDYRGDRKHLGFVQNLSLTQDQLKETIRDAFNVGSASDALAASEAAEMDRLVRDKYLLPDWNHRR